LEADLSISRSADGEMVGAEAWLALARGTSSSELSNFIVGGRNRVGWWVVFGEAQRDGAVKAVRSANLGERLEFETERL